MHHRLNLTVIVSLVALVMAEAQPPQTANPGAMVIRIKLAGSNNDPNVANPMGANPAEAERSVFAVVPYKMMYQDVIYQGKAVNQARNPRGARWIHHDFGKSIVYGDDNIIQLYPLQAGNEEARLRAKHSAWTRNRGKLEELIKFAIEALIIDQVELAQKYTQELVDTTKASKITDERILAVAKHYEELANSLTAVLPAHPQLTEWKSRLQSGTPLESNHYTLLPMSTQADPDYTNQVLAELERNFKGFYLAQSVTGQTVPMPKNKMLVVLAARSNDVGAMKIKLEGAPINSDSFYMPQHQIVVLSPERLDETGRLFQTGAKAVFIQGFIKDDLLKGKFPPLQVMMQEEITKFFTDTIIASTYAVANRTLERDTIRAAVTREGTRQLLYANGTLPRYVMLPKWLDNGYANLFWKPKEPGVVTLANEQLGAVLPVRAGYGMPNYLMLREWKQLDKAMALADKPETLLKNVLNDAYFDGLRTAKDPDIMDEPVAVLPVDPQPNPNRGDPSRPMVPMAGPDDTSASSQDLSPRGKLDRKAHATAWALSWHITRPEMAAQLKKYHEQLHRLPRDLRLDKTEMTKIFAQSFDLWDGAANTIDAQKFTQFADNWKKAMSILNPNWEERELQPKSTDPNNPNPNPNPNPNMRN